MDELCRNCRYWTGKREGTTSSVGDCRRHAPTVSHISKWPKTHPGDWCGEFKSMEEINHDEAQ